MDHGKQKLNKMKSFTLPLHTEMLMKNKITPVPLFSQTCNNNNLCLRQVLNKMHKC